MHNSLLKLPWCDIFTTNWDTLLERTCRNVVDRHYNTVHSMEEIPLASQHRIVKLHGSIPAYFPLIVTEEDYRTYPVRFAPFVNTVQQAMMEKVFLLIGFSGNDPNFLHWSGWVRDNLGSAAPKVYLAGWLGLSPHRRRMLEDINVVPIDLALHPKADKWPEHLRQKYATEWILQSLEGGRMHDFTDWPPEHKGKPTSVPEYLQPIQSVTSEGGNVESTPQSDQGESFLEELRLILQTWGKNRKTYPGWLVAPIRTRHRLSSNTNEWEPKILNVLDKLDLVERLTAIHELIWRRAVLLEPVTSELECAASEILGMVDCYDRTINGTNCPEKDWVTIRLAWRNVALALVTNSRYDLDKQTFETWIEKLNPFIDDDPDVFHQIHHERCLWATFFLDYKELDVLIKNWNTENCDTAWLIRKAALLFDMGRDNEGVDLVDKTLNSIREIPISDRSVAGPSRESWCLWMRWQRDFENWKLIHDRWTELAQQKCDAMMERYHILSSVKSDGDSGNESTAPSFELGVKRIKGLTYSNHNPTVQAYRAVRLTEVAGLPQVVNDMNVASELFNSAAEQLSISNAELAIRLLLRASNSDSDKTLQRVLTRTKVANLEDTSVKNLVESCEGLIEYALAEIPKATSVFWVERMRVSLEVLSRLVLRLDADDADAVFNKALMYYSNHMFIQHIWLAKPLKSLLKRSWEALPNNRRDPYVLDILNLPIAGLDNNHKNPNFFPEPSEILVNDREPRKSRRTAETRQVWEESVRLIIRGLRGNDQARRRASKRVLAITLWGKLLKSESESVAKALWENTESNALPNRTDLPDWVFLILPEPEPGLANRCFRKKWLSISTNQNESLTDLDRTITNAGYAMSIVENHSGTFELTQDELTILFEAVDKWADAPVPKRDDPYVNRLVQETTLKGLSYILDVIALPQDIGTKILSKVRKLSESGISGFGLIPGLVRALPECHGEFASILRSGFVSDNSDIAEGAIVGLHEWLVSAGKKHLKIKCPPDDLVREIGIIVAVRRKTGLSQALSAAKWIFDEGSVQQMTDIRKSVVQGLSYMIDELKYEKQSDHFEDDDVPLLRWRCAQLANAISKHKTQDDESVIDRWIETAKHDPLPEVRHL